MNINLPFILLLFSRPISYAKTSDKTYKNSDSFQAATDRIKEQHKDESRNVCNAVLSLFKNALSLHNKEKFSIE